MTDSLLVSQLGSLLQTATHHFQAFTLYMKDPRKQIVKALTNYFSVPEVRG